jgi:N6-adenosine-specific RNA methylase IME4
VGRVQALLIEIDENLQRAELTELERAQHVTERKRLWESLHPETKRGGNPGAGRGRGKKKPGTCRDAESASLQQGPPALSFAEETSRRTRMAKRTLAKSAQIGENICREAQALLKGTPVEDRKEDLLKIARLADKDEQLRIARQIHGGAAATYLQARRQLEAERIRAEPRPLPEGPFRVIAIDPPWDYGKRAGDPSHRGAIPYPSMTVDAIQALPVARLAHQDCVLWLWTTNAHMRAALDVLAAWHFEHKTILTWLKAGRLGVGDWLRGQTEHCLLAVRGRPVVTLASQATGLVASARGHSRKPDEFYAQVESLCPGSKVELFARVRRPGWVAWGGDHQWAVPEVETG